MKAYEITSISYFVFAVVATCPILNGAPMDILASEKLISSSVFVLKTSKSNQSQIPIIGDAVKNSDLSWLHPGSDDLLVFCFKKTRFSERVDGSIGASKGSSYIIRRIKGLDYVLISGEIIELDKVIEQLKR